MKNGGMYAAFQHGAAKSEAEDPEGTKTVEGVAKYLSSLRLNVVRIEHSGKERTRQTAEIMAAHLRPEGKAGIGASCAISHNLT